MKKRLFTLLLCAALLVSLCAPAAAEEDGAEETYTAWTWDGNRLVKSTPQIPAGITEITQENVETLELNETTGGWYIVRDSGISSGYGSVVIGTVNLILADGCSLDIRCIVLRENSSLSIYAQSDGEKMGELTSHSAGGLHAGIEVNAGSTLTIHGGKVTATGEMGAGIGGGLEETGGTVTINGGKVTAISVRGGAGIGGGENGGGGNITINGGTVEVTSRSGAGIGGGDGGNGGIIEINGGEVTATGQLGAGIGGGKRGAGGTITISGGKVEATSKNGGAGIGGGYGGDGNNGGDGGTIIISGGMVTARSDDWGAGIGGGSSGENVGGAGGEITISGGTVTASSGDWGAGIGGGGSAGVGGSGGTITISGGTVTATSDVTGTGIGGGKNTAGGPGASGTFITGPNGSAFIVANGISDQSGKENGSWSGVIFEGRDGKVYGNEITLATDATIPARRTLKIEADQTLIVGKDVKLTNEGTIDNQGTINNLGTIDGPGKIEGNAVVVPTAHGPADRWERDSSGHWHPCVAEDCAENHRYGEAPHTPGAAATCTRPQTCAVCGYTLAAASGHTPGPAATCTEPQTCTVCGQEVAPALGHSFGEQVPQKDATTTSTGMKAHYLCSRCGNYFDENKNPTTAEALTIPKRAGGGGGGGSYTPPTYPPTVERPGEGGGMPSISPSYPKQGDTVTVTPKPDEGYEVDKITVTDRNGRDVEVTKKPDGTYTFTQPAGTVTIDVTYVPMAALPWENPFDDVSEGDWYYEAVRFVQERGLMNGYSNGRFGPNDTLSRAQLAQILFHKEGGPVVNYLMDFSDVAGEAWYAEAIRWAASQGIVGGYGNGTFGPNDPITREQLAVMLWRYVGSPAATDEELHFNDTDEISGFALEAMRWAVENGILNGYGDGRLGPQGQATRAQAAQMLKNFIENQEEDT